MLKRKIRHCEILVNQRRESNCEEVTCDGCDPRSIWRGEEKQEVFLNARGEPTQLLSGKRESVVGSMNPYSRIRIQITQP